MKFTSFFKNYKLQTFLAPFFKLLEALIDLLVPFVIANIIDKGINGMDNSYIFYGGLMLVVFAIVGLGLSILGQYFSAKVAVYVTSDIKEKLFNNIQKLSFDEIDELTSSKLTNVMSSDMNQVQTGINLTLRLFLRSPFIVFGAAIMAIFVSPSTSLVFWISIPILSFVIFGIMLITIPKYKDVQTSLDGIVNMTKENLTGARVIRAFGNEEEEKQLFKQRAKELNKKHNRVSNISAIMNPATLIIINVAICVLIYFGALKVNVGSLTQGEVIALYNYMSQILIELVKLANLIITITKSVASYKRASYILNLKSNLIYKDNDINNDAYIVFDNVSFKYKDASTNSLTNINFKVNKNETIGIIGGTGSGKSTLVNLLPHFYDPTEGNIYIDGKNIQSYSNNDLRCKISVVLQKASLFKGNIKENLDMGNNYNLDDAISISQSTNIIEKKGGIEAPVEQMGRNLSGGEKQRLSIARALARNPEILILDDSSSALDYATDYNLRKAIKSLDCTLFIISQRASSVIDCNKIIVLDNGNIDSIGTHEELMKSSKLYKEIYYSQFEEGDE